MPRSASVTSLLFISVACISGEEAQPQEMDVESDHPNEEPAPPINSQKKGSKKAPEKSTKKLPAALRRLKGAGEVGSHALNAVNVGF